ncbi:MAG TPA: hypothetical protein VGM69_20905 [Chloroflexota bacterium]|jgi:hypothetical protein
MLDIVAEAGFVDLELGRRLDILRGADGEAEARPFDPSGLTFRCRKPEGRS